MCCRYVEKNMATVQLAPYAGGAEQTCHKFPSTSDVIMSPPQLQAALTICNGRRRSSRISVMCLFATFMTQFILSCSIIMNVEYDI